MKYTFCWMGGRLVLSDSWVDWTEAEEVADWLKLQECPASLCSRGCRRQLYRRTYLQTKWKWIFGPFFLFWFDIGFDCLYQDQVCLGRLVGCVRNVLVARWGWLMWGDRVSIDTAHTDTTNHCHAPVNPFYRNFNVCHRYLKILCSTALRGGQTGHSAIYRQSKSWKSCFLCIILILFLMHIGLMPTNESKTAQPEVF